MVNSIYNSEHYIWGDNCEGWHLLKSDSLSVIQERMPPGTSEQLHYHEFSQQLFYILSGEATFEVDGKLITVREKESIHISKGAKHKIENKTDQNLEFLIVSQPKAHGDRKNL